MIKCLNIFCCCFVSNSFQTENKLSNSSLKILERSKLHGGKNFEHYHGNNSEVILRKKMRRPKQIRLPSLQRCRNHVPLRGAMH